jgi:hypothetical protein
VLISIFIDLFLIYLQHLLCKIQREAAETEWNERSSDSLVRINYLKNIYAVVSLVLSSTQEESPDGSYSTCMLFLKQGSARTFSGTNVWEFCLFLLQIKNA